MWKYWINAFCKHAKFIGVIGFICTFFSDLPIFKWLCFFALLVVVEIILNFPLIKCSILQMIGIVKVEKKYGQDIPSIENYKSEVQYDLPFEGEWTVVNGCFTKDFSHSWEIPTQRYAYDFLILDENGKSNRNQIKNVTDYYCYDQPILAPADGVVEAIVNNAEDSVIIGKGRFFRRSSHIAGNYILLKHNENEYSMLAHLKKDSIVIEVGEKVHRGQKIATCGNTGNSTEPHLHFQLQTGRSFYYSAGLPIRFSKVNLSMPSNYKNIDPRPNMDISKVPDGLITRGYNVSNK
ncbi:MAG: Peptidase [Herbinix sp.]|jgi:hypothetical protein|nr:Peptidase [Herbinix sp.]